MNLFIPSSYVLNKITAAILEGGLKNLITHEAYYAIKQRYHSRTSGIGCVDRFYFKSPESFTTLLSRIFWLGHVSFVGMDIFQFLAKFSVDYLSYLIVPTIKLILRQFPSFASHVVYSPLSFYLFPHLSASCLYLKCSCFLSILVLKEF